MFVPSSLSGVGRVVPDVHRDDRGTFVEVFDLETFSRIGITDSWVQDALSLSTRAGTVRGLHFQVPPSAQAKLVRVVRGRLWDVVVDLRTDSPTFGRHEAFELVAGTESLYIPVGIAHGFVTLEDNTEITYKMSNHYSPTLARGIRWDDPDLGIDWPVGSEVAILSDRDRQWPLMREFDSPFRTEPA